jgi:hypothetical protein
MVVGCSRDLGGVSARWISPKSDRTVVASEEFRIRAEEGRSPLEALEAALLDRAPERHLAAEL